MAPPALPGFRATTGLSAADATGPGPRGLPVAVAAAVVVGFPCFMCIPSIHAVALYPGGIAECVCRVSSSATLAFPVCPSGRLPRLAFRGLIERLLALRPASSRDHQVVLSIEGSDEFVASFAASIATGQATLPRRDFHPLEYTRIHGARTHDLIRMVSELRTAFLRLEDATHHLFQTPKERVVPERPTGAAVPAQVSESSSGTALLSNAFQSPIIANNEKRGQTHILGNMGRIAARESSQSTQYMRPSPFSSAAATS